MGNNDNTTNNQIDFNALEKFLQHETIPKIQKKPTTFLGIAKQPHYENVWSNIYGFYFKPTAEHHLNDLFIKSLVKIITHKTKKDFLFDSDFNVKTEVSTKEGRIDLLLYNDDQAIIIENKVYHVLNNDLKDYWESEPQEQKQGIVLSLVDITIPKEHQENFINITHLTLMKEVMRNLPDYFANANEKYLILLQDFYQNILNLSHPMDTKHLEFYYNYEPEITNLKKIRDEVINHIKEQTENAYKNISEKTGKFQLKGQSGDTEKRLRYYSCTENNNLMFTVEFASLKTKDRKLFIDIEIQNELIKKKELLKGCDFSDEEKDIMPSDIYTNTNNRWLHIARKEFILTNEQIMRLTNFIVEKIDKTSSCPFSTIYQKVKKVLVDDQKE